VGVVSPITGQGAIAGQYIRNGIDLAVKQFAPGRSIKIEGYAILNPAFGKGRGKITAALLEIRGLGIQFGGFRAVDSFHLTLEEGWAGSDLRRGGFREHGAGAENGHSGSSEGTASELANMERVKAAYLGS
jgi:hypothetical protein